MNRDDLAWDESLRVAWGERDWARAVELLNSRLATHPSSHWCWTRLGLVQSFLGRHEEAVRASDMAVHLCPRCPLVLWDRGCIFANAGQLRDALGAFTQIADMGPHEIARHDCSEGDTWSLDLFDDATYHCCRLALALGDATTAARHLSVLVEQQASLRRVRIPAQEIGRLSRAVVSAALERQSLGE